MGPCIFILASVGPYRNMKDMIDGLKMKICTHGDVIVLQAQELVVRISLWWRMWCMGLEVKVKT